MSNNRDKIALILAGGQIVHRWASSGTVSPPLEQEELREILPDDVRDKVTLVDWSYQPVCHYTLRMCGDLVQLAAGQIKEGAKGAIVTCGTQALTEVAYYADLVWNYPQPLIFTSSINYSQAPGAETRLHLIQSVEAATSQAIWGQGVLVCIQDAVYAASELFQLSNYSRFGHVSLPSGPVAAFSEPRGGLTHLRTPRRGKVLDVETLPARNIEIVDATLGGGDILLNALLDGRVSDLDGLVISAFGGGDVPPSWIALLRKIMKANVPLVLASRCPQGGVLPGRDFEGSASRLLDMGLLSAGNRTPLQARIRLALGLGAGLSGADLRSYMQDH